MTDGSGPHRRVVGFDVLSVEVPATSANLGPGFDALGIALDIYVKVKLTLAERDAITYRGTGSVPDTPNNLIHQGFHAVYGKLEEQPPKVHFIVDNDIPLARGLGSSSAALVAGAALADALLGEPLGRDAVFQLAAAIEGHPDNVGPAVFGGFTVAAPDEGGRFSSLTLPLPKRWRLLFGVPDFELLTAESRAVLPDLYPRNAAILASSRAALLTAAVALDRPDLLPVASIDTLHEPYRRALIADFDRCAKRLREAGAAAVYLSGGGPTIGVVSVTDAVTERCERLLSEYATSAGEVLQPESAAGYRLDAK